MPLSLDIPSVSTLRNRDTCVPILLRSIIDVLLHHHADVNFATGSGRTAYALQITCIKSTLDHCCMAG